MTEPGVNSSLAVCTNFKRSAGAWGGGGLPEVTGDGGVAGEAVHAEASAPTPHAAAPTNTARRPSSVRLAVRAPSSGFSRACSIFCSDLLRRTILDRNAVPSQRQRGTCFANQ